DDLAALVPRLSPAGCAAATGVLAMAGERGRRAQELLVLEPGLSAAARAELAKGLSSNLERVPPSAAFVVKLLEHDDAELKRRGAWPASSRRRRDAGTTRRSPSWTSCSATARTTSASSRARRSSACAIRSTADPGLSTGATAPGDDGIRMQAMADDHPPRARR